MQKEDVEALKKLIMREEHDDAASEGQLGAVIGEVYSPPRVTEEATKFELNAGMACDITVGWDFRRQEDRERAKKYALEKKPKLVKVPRREVYANRKHRQID